MKFILAEKKEMTQQFAEDGTVIPVTRVVAGPCVITQSKTADKDGYTAVQVAFGKKNHINKPLAGHLKDLGKFRYLKEFKISEEEANKIKIGDKITVKIFQPGDIVKVSGTSKGKGFQGVVKRWGFHGSPASHGHKDQLRMPGSIGATGPAHVFKGTKMGGRMGGSQVTVTNLEIVKINPETNEIFIKGAVPGPRNNLLLLSGAGDLVLEEIVEKKTENSDQKSEEKIEDKKIENSDQKTEENFEGHTKVKDKNETVQHKENTEKVTKIAKEEKEVELESALERASLSSENKDVIRKIYTPKNTPESSDNKKS